MAKLAILYRFGNFNFSAASLFLDLLPFFLTNRIFCYICTLFTMENFSKNIRTLIYGLLALALFATSVARYAPVRISEQSSLTASASKSKGEKNDYKIDIGSSHEALLSFLQLDLSQEYFIYKPAFVFFAEIRKSSPKELSAKPLSSYFRKLFSIAIAINAP